MCEVTYCKNRNQDGDEYFCGHHRIRWRWYCKVANISERVISAEEECQHLNYFAMRGLDDVRAN